MNGATLLIVGIIFFLFAYRFYGRYLARLFEIDSGRETPAHTRTDGIDYVPAKFPVLFGHHFASIAGAGPIVGPVLAVYLGWGPVALWVLFGCVFIGAMHDFAALLSSVRNEGRSIGHIIEQHLGYSGRQIFLVFCWSALILVVAIFALLVAQTFVETPAVATASVLFIAMAPVFGYLVYRRGLSLLLGSLVFVPLLFLFIWIGTLYPLDLSAMFGVSAEAAKNIWLVVLFIYVFIASISPVWILLQPRDYLNSYLLYAMVLVGFVSILVASPEFNMPAFTGWFAEKPRGGMGSVFPILYVTVACGACSGFHALVSSGTTAKQVASENHILPIGYGAMLVEGLVALMALISVAILSESEYMNMLSSMTPVSAFASGLSGFAATIGIPASIGMTFISLTISAFMLTTLDTATRLTRFSWQELFLPGRLSDNSTPSGPIAVFSHTVTATLIAVAIAAYLASTGTAWQIWPVFGASNQLLAALTLLVITLILIRKKSNFWISLVPMLFMSTITCWALVALIRRNMGENIVLVMATGFLLVMALILIVQAVFSLKGLRKES
ncbi:MAG: carbon starvation protein A [Deltaproteobacteria bacterium]|nr:carbon starvation protein A [Deltaproteobacteria bacterium]